MNKLGMMAIAGMLIAVIGMRHLGEGARLLAWGLAICISILVYWMNALQRQIDELKSASANSK